MAAVAHKLNRKKYALPKHRHDRWLAAGKKTWTETGSSIGAFNISFTDGAGDAFDQRGLIAFTAVSTTINPANR